MGQPVVTVASGGRPVVVSTNGFGMPVDEATNGLGIAVTQVTNFGMPVIYVTGGSAVIAPTLVLTSATSDATPDFTLTGDLAAADVVRFQYANNSSFTGATDITHTITAPEDAANSFSFSTGSLANGAWWFRARVERPVVGNSGWSNTVTETIAASAYTGPGDVVSGAVGWWGLRAYNAAKAAAGVAAIDIVKASDGSALQTIHVLSNGALDTATIAALGYAVVVTKWYDQTGNGQDLVQATLANMPALTLSAIGALPTLTFVGTKSFTKTLFTETQPATVTAFTRCINTTAGTQTVFTCTSYAMTLDNGQPLGGPIAPQMVGSGGSLSGYPKSINTWYAIAGLYNSTTSDFRFDGTSAATGDVGTGAPSNQTITVGGPLSNFNVGEIGTWQSTFSGQFGNMSSNQHTYWGI